MAKKKPMMFGKPAPGKKVEAFKKKDDALPKKQMGATSTRAKRMKRMEDSDIPV